MILIYYCFFPLASLYYSYRFAKYREVREALHNFEGVLLACLALAFEELSPHLQFMSEVCVCLCLCLFVYFYQILECSRL